MFVFDKDASGSGMSFISFTNVAWATQLRRAFSKLPFVTGAQRAGFADRGEMQCLFLFTITSFTAHFCKDAQEMVENHHNPFTPASFTCCQLPMLGSQAKAWLWKSEDWGLNRPFRFTRPPPGLATGGCTSAGACRSCRGQG